MAMPTRMATRKGMMATAIWKPSFAASDEDLVHLHLPGDAEQDDHQHQEGQESTRS